MLMSDSDQAAETDKMLVLMSAKKVVEATEYFAVEESELSMGYSLASTMASALEPQTAVQRE